MIGWKEIGSAALGLAISGAVWLGSETVESKALHAAQKVESTQQRKELDDTSERLTAVERAVISMEHIGKEMSEINKRLAALQEEKSTSKKR